MTKAEKLRDSICKRLKIENDSDGAKARQLILDVWQLYAAAREEGIAEGAAQKGTCEWKEDGYGSWNTECGESFGFDEGGPAENHSRYCCYCGKPIKAVPHKEREP